MNPKLLYFDKSFKVVLKSKDMQLVSSQNSHFGSSRLFVYFENLKSEKNEFIAPIKFLVLNDKCYIVDCKEIVYFRSDGSTSSVKEMVLLKEDIHTANQGCKFIIEAKINNMPRIGLKFKISLC